MKRNLLFLATALFFNNMGVKSQVVDVTETYIPNAGFEECEVVATNDKGAADIHTDYSTELGTDYDAQGWQLVSVLKSANGGAISYADDLHVQYSKWNVAGDQGPAAGPQGTVGNKGLCFAGNASVVYRQSEPITLPAGSYKLTVNVWARNGETSNPKPTQQVVNDKTGFMPESGESDDALIPAVRKSLQFKSNDWDTEVLEFELTEPTTGRFQLSYGTSYFVVIDDLKLEHNGSVVTTALVKVIAKAKTLNATLNNEDLALAISDAEAFAANPTSQEDVSIQAEALYSAMGAALTASDEVVDITAAYVENPSFETGVLDPWEWGANSGYVSEPTKTESNAYIDGTKVAYFSTSGQNSISQSIAYLPAGLYILEARLNGNANLVLGTSVERKGGSDALYQRVASSVRQLEAGSHEIGIKSRSAVFGVDDFHLYYGKDEESLNSVILQHVKADAQSLLDDEQFDIVTGSERTELTEAIANDDVTTINTKANAFYKAMPTYSNFEKAKTAALLYNKEVYPYADEELLQQIETMCSMVAESASHAEMLATQLTETCSDVYVSNAYCEGVKKTDYTNNIICANATEAATGWGVKNMAIRTDKAGWKNPKTGQTDNIVYGVTQDYYRACKDQASILKQTLKDLPAGRYVLSMTAMGSNNLVVNVFFNNSPIGDMKMSGTSGGGKYGAGWNDYVIEFQKADDTDMPLQLQCKPTANYQDWYIDNFRLYLLNDESTDSVRSVEAASTAAGIRYDLSGRRVSKPAKGIYIIDGKKVVMQ